MQTPVEIPVEQFQQSYYDSNGKAIWAANNGSKGTPTTKTL